MSHSFQQPNASRVQLQPFCNDTVAVISLLAHVWLNRLATFVVTGPSHLPATRPCCSHLTCLLVQCVWGYMRVTPYAPCSRSSFLLPSSRPGSPPSSPPTSASVSIRHPYLGLSWCAATPAASSGRARTTRRRRGNCLVGRAPRARGHNCLIVASPAAASVANDATCRRHQRR